MSGESVLCVSAAVPLELVEPLLEIIDAEGFTPTSWHDLESGSSRVDLFLDAPDGIERAKAALLDAACLLGLEPVAEVVEIAEGDWADSWKRFFKVEHISERVVIRPSWEEYVAQPGEVVITIDPGMSFGTGKHGTTQGCLQLLDRLAMEGSSRSVLDMGCGTGILAIGAALLGFSGEIRGFDNDPVCMTSSLENAALNGVEVEFYTDDLSHPHVAADIVVANILAPVLIQYAAEIVGSLRQGDGARLILSGILESQYGGVRQAYLASGMEEVETVLIGEWRSGLFKRR